MINGLLFETFHKSISPIQLSEDPAEYYQQVKQALRCESFIDAISKDKTSQLLVDQDALLKMDNLSFRFSLMPHPIFGNAILIGRDPATGNKKDLDDFIHAFSFEWEFYDREQTERFRVETLDWIRKLHEGRR